MPRTPPPPDPATTPLAERQQWPKLSETLPHFRAPDICQSCGGGVTDGKSVDPSLRQRVRWIEHDEWERPTTTIVVLCLDCSDRIVPPHPRLYAKIEVNKPHPGTMLPLCVDCTHRDGLQCSHPDSRGNGGRGLEVTYTMPTKAFMDGTRNGRRAGWVQTFYPDPPSKCAGKSIVQPVVRIVQPAPRERGE